MQTACTDILAVAESADQRAVRLGPAVPVLVLSAIRPPETWNGVNQNTAPIQSSCYTVSRE
ncbi:hypothetical protein J6590_020779 [Homalodisca vitripennis]|nr:hypothetical protein J6590_020779 [Homalodisca vitripennis]